MLLTLLPDSRVLDIEPGETLLAALRRQKEPVSYSCEDGRCGLCHCVLTYPDRISSENCLSADPLDKSIVLACQTAPNADCLLELPDRNDILVLPPQIIRAQIVAIVPMAERVRRIFLRPQKSVQFAPGQHFEVTLSSNIIRMYSAACLPSDPELIFDIQIHRDGRASRYLVENLKVGDTLRLRGPLGTTYLRRHGVEPTLYVSSGTGLGPMMALLRASVDAETKNPMHIYSGFLMSEDAYGTGDLASLVKKLRVVRRNERVIGGGILGRGERHGLLTDIIADDLGCLSGFRAYIFGSPHAVDSTARLLRRMGIAPERLHIEPFHYSSL